MDVYRRISEAAKLEGIKITPGAVKELFEHEKLVGYSGPESGILLLLETSTLLPSLLSGASGEDVIQEACRTLYGQDFEGEPSEYVKALFTPSKVKPLDTKKMEELL